MGMHTKPRERWPRISFDFGFRSGTGSTGNYQISSKLSFSPHTTPDGYCTSSILDMLKECIELTGGESIHTVLPMQGLHFYGKEEGLYIVRTTRQLAAGDDGYSRFASDVAPSGYGVSVYEVYKMDGVYARFISHQPDAIYKRGYDTEGLLFEEGDATLAESLYKSLMWKGGIIEYVSTIKENFYVFRTRTETHH